MKPTIGRIVRPPIRVSYGLTVAGRRYLPPLQQLKSVDAEREEVAQAS